MSPKPRLTVAATPQVCLLQEVNGQACLERRQEEGGTLSIARLGWAWIAGPEHALRAKVDICFPGSPCFPCPVTTPRAPSTPRTLGLTKVWTTSPFNLASPGEQSHYLVIDLPPLFPDK